MFILVLAPKQLREFIASLEPISLRTYLVDPMSQCNALNHTKDVGLTPFLPDAVIIVGYSW